MKLLLDENLPKRLKQDFSEHQIFTVANKAWIGKNNGELLKLMLAEKFDALITFDKNLQHQQNFIKYSFTIFVLSATDNTYTTLKPLTIKIKSLLKKISAPGSIEITK
jgi:predicted nuclease of predicted toxin-antitoxin system